MYPKGGRLHYDEGAMNYRHTEKGLEKNHPQAENRKYRFYKEGLSVKKEEKG